MSGGDPYCGEKKGRGAVSINTGVHRKLSGRCYSLKGRGNHPVLRGRFHRQRAQAGSPVPEVLAWSSGSQESVVAVQVGGAVRLCLVKMAV